METLQWLWLAFILIALSYIADDIKESNTQLKRIADSLERIESIEAVQANH